MVEQATQVDPGAFQRRAAQQTRRRRRRRVWLSIACYGLATAVMVFASLAHRDYRAVRSNERLMGELQALFQADYLDRPLPQKLPLDDPEGPRVDVNWRKRLCYVPQNQWRLDELERVAVCYNDVPLTFYVRPDGRHLILFDGREYTLEWLSEAEFRQQHDRYGIRLVTDHP